MTIKIVFVFREKTKRKKIKKTLINRHNRHKSLFFNNFNMLGDDDTGDDSGQVSSPVLKC